MIDQDEAVWLAEVMMEAVANLDDRPGVTVEVDGSRNQWVQVLFEQHDEDGSLGGYNLNFPYRGRAGDPIKVLTEAGLSLPPDTSAVDWEDGGFATIWVRPDAPVVALAHFIGDILERVIGAAPGSKVTAQIEYGF